MSQSFRRRSCVFDRWRSYLRFRVGTPEVPQRSGGGSQTSSRAPRAGHRNGCSAPKRLPRDGLATPHWVHRTFDMAIHCAGRRYAGNGLPRTLQDPRRGKDIPTLEHPNDAIVQVTLAAICGSDLHLYHGMMPDTSRHDLRP